MIGIEAMGGNSRSSLKQACPGLSESLLTTGREMSNTGVAAWSWQSYPAIPAPLSFGSCDVRQASTSNLFYSLYSIVYDSNLAVF